MVVINGRRSEETRKRISEGLKGHVISEETRKKISESLTGEKHPNWGKKLPEETRRKLSERQLGEKHHMYGKHHKIESRDNISKNLRKYHIDDNLPRYLYRYNSKKHSGYRVTYFDENNNKKEKTITDKSLTLEEKLEKAKEFHKLKWNNISTETAS